MSDKRRIKDSGVVKNGLVLWLDGKDFSNSPASSKWIDKSGKNNDATPSGFGYTKGIKYSNMINNGDMETQGNWSLGVGCVLSTDDKYTNSKSLKVTPTGVSHFAQQYITIPNGHIVYASCKAKLTAYTTGSLGVSIRNYVDLSDVGANGNVNTSTLNSWQSVSTRYTVINGGVRVIAGSYTTPTLSGFVDNVLLVDLTETFGSGNEPTQSWCDANLTFTVSSEYLGSGSNENYGVMFDGVDDKCTIPTTNLPSAFTSITVESDINIHDSRGMIPIVDCWDYGGNKGFCMRVFNGILSFLITNGSTYFTAGIGFTYTGRFRITGTYNGSQLKLYIDGVLRYTLNVSNASIVMNTNVKLGYAVTNAGYGKNTYYSVKIYNRALIDAEILQNYNVSK